MIEGDKMNSLSVLFLCTHNSVRSQMAEALMHLRSGGKVRAFSAGIEPGTVHPFTIAVLQEIGIDTQGLRSKSLTDFVGKQTFDYLITVCSDADKNCPFFPGAGTRLHWPFEDPSAYVGSDSERLHRFRMIRDAIDVKIVAWLKSLT